MRTTGRWGSVSLTRFNTVMPPMPGILTSTSSMSGLATGTIRRAVSPSWAIILVNPSLFMRAESNELISRSSSTMSTRVALGYIFPPGSTNPVERIEHLQVRVEVSFHSMKHPQKEDAGLAAFQSFINTLGHKSVSYTHLRAHETR